MKNQPNNTTSVPRTTSSICWELCSIVYVTCIQIECIHVCIISCCVYLSLPFKYTPAYLVQENDEKHAWFTSMKHKNFLAKLAFHLSVTLASSLSALVCVCVCEA